MLKTEKNTPKIKQLVLKAAKSKFTAKRINQDKGNAVFEHGQWWFQILNEEDEIVSYSVVDAVPGVDNLGLDFEEL